MYMYQFLNRNPWVRLATLPSEDEWQVVQFNNLSSNLDSYINYDIPISGIQIDAIKLDRLKQLRRHAYHLRLLLNR